MMADYLFIIKRCNLKRKSKPYISFSPSLWGTNVFFAKTVSEIKLTYGGEEFAYPDLLAFEGMYSVKCRVVGIKDEAIYIRQYNNK